MQVAFAQYAFVLLDHVEPCFAEDLPVEGVQDPLQHDAGTVSWLWVNVSKESALVGTSLGFWVGLR